MFTALKRLFHRPAIQLGRLDTTRAGDSTRLRNTRFVSFLNHQGSFGRVNSDRHDARLRRRKAIKSLFWSGGLATFAWVAIESAKALTLF